MNLEIFNAMITTFGFDQALAIVKEREHEFLMMGDDKRQTEYCNFLWVIYSAQG